MLKENFWFISLVALFIIGVAVNWNTPIRITVIANAVIVLIDIFYNIRRIVYAGREKKN